MQFSNVAWHVGHGHGRLGASQRLRLGQFYGPMSVWARGIFKLFALPALCSALLCSVAVAAAHHVYLRLLHSLCNFIVVVVVLCPAASAIAFLFIPIALLYSALSLCDTIAAIELRSIDLNRYYEREREREKE